MEYNYDNFWATLLIITGIFFLALAINITIKIVFGQDIDPNTYCLYKDQYPFNNLCDKQQIYELYEQMLNRSIEWNNR